MVLDKEKVSKIEIYDSKERFIALTSVFSFPKVLFKGATVPIVIKSANLSHIRRGDTAVFVFEYYNGDRYKTMARLDNVTKVEIETKIGDVTLLEERRRSFKVNTNEPALVFKSKSAREKGLESTILNINLGGVLLFCEEALVPGEQFYLYFLDGEIDIYTKVLRRQENIDGKLIGYGCQFVEVTEENEETISRYIMACQIAERERRRNMEDND